MHWRAKPPQRVERRNVWSTGRKLIGTLKGFVLVVDVRDSPFRVVIIVYFRNLYYMPAVCQLWGTSSRGP